MPSNKQRIIFLVNNYDQALGVFSERRIDESSGEAAQFRARLAQQRELFVEESLLGGFGRLIAFVQQTEVQIDGGADKNAAVEVCAVELGRRAVKGRKRRRRAP